VTRTTLLGLLGRAGLAIEERPFSVAEARSAREAFVTAATATVVPVVAVDGIEIGDGRPGPVTLKLRQLFRASAEKSPPNALLR
jgi:D-alanine transaminase